VVEHLIKEILWNPTSAVMNGTRGMIHRQLAQSLFLNSIVLGSSCAKLHLCEIFYSMFVCCYKKIGPH
jgi:hypothetical protein